MKDIIGPAHVYNPQTGNGIQLIDGTANLFINKEFFLSRPHTAKSPYEFWYDLHFTSLFPEITHWYLYSAWTQYVAFSKPQGVIDDGENSIWGWVWFCDKDTPPDMWTITPPSTANGNSIITVPMPPLNVHRGNIPLRLALAQQLLSVALTGLNKPEKFYPLTSLVTPAQMPLAFPKEHISIRLNGIDLPYREALCEIMSLSK
ncbi:MAG: hypothetical protein AB9888_13040 [Bacteroidales bacterium]